ncbi:spore germination protein GerPC [Gottfriedia luciferensis]|uniref:spore germination protein GerPC n=1 Tax=Gottfriedia luciferensis TaxID=178774 RepID=UPI000B449C66|nr:spore germination protein GerPC [Gottfriedia luciferensis]
MNQIETKYIQIEQLIYEQSLMIEQLQNRIAQLEATVHELSQRPETRIDRIEYKFDQLKVENLNGTLTIGLNPLHAPKFEDLTVENQQIDIKPDNHMKALRAYIEDRINFHLKDEALETILQLEAELRVSVDDYYRQMMIDDIRNQMDIRIPYYIDLYKNKPNFAEDPLRYSEEVVLHMLGDIRTAYSAFLQNLPHNLRKEHKG